MATKPRTILTPGEAAAPAAAEPATEAHAEAAAPAAEEDAGQGEAVDTPSDLSAADEVAKLQAQLAEAHAKLAAQQEAKPVAVARAIPAPSNQPKLTPEGWVVPSHYGAQPKQVV